MNTFVNKYVYISIVNYNKSEKTISCIRSILKSTYDKFKIIVVDNCSSTGSLEVLQNWILINNKDKIIKLLRNNKNGGYSYGNNKAIYSIIFNRYKKPL